MKARVQHYGEQRSMVMGQKIGLEFTAEQFEG